VRFPLGGLTKEEVRAAAHAAGLPNAAKPESQEICFVPDGDYAGFVAAASVARGRRAVPGAIVDDSGREVGEHDGVHAFTIGQRRGLGNLAAPGPLYVTAIDPARARVTVGPRTVAERAALTVRDVRWLAAPSDLALSVQVRHRGTPLPCRVALSGTTATVSLDTPVLAAPGQAAVFYADDRVIGGGWLASTRAS
jgi:tRNA-specific 2-thiouridylase